MSVPDHELDEPPEPEPCLGADAYECRCPEHLAFWREVLADQRYQDFKDELPYAN